MTFRPNLATLKVDGHGEDDDKAAWQPRSGSWPRLGG